MSDLKFPKLPAGHPANRPEHPRHEFHVKRMEALTPPPGLKKAEAQPEAEPAEKKPAKKKNS